MFNKLILATVFFLAAFVQVGRAQEDFCEAVTAILRDAPNKFKNVRANLTQTSHGSEAYKSSIMVPGTITSRFVYSMGCFYEGALNQSKNLDHMKAAYDKYKGLLEKCLTPLGLNMRLNENFYPGLSEYKKVVFLPAYSKNTDFRKLKGHISMEVDFSKETGLYTLIFYIYEH